MNPRKQSRRDLQERMNINLRVLTLIKTGQVKDCDPLFKLHWEESINICRKLLLLS